MYYIYYRRNHETLMTTMTDLRGACIVAFNEVKYFACDSAWVVDGETGKILYEAG